MEKEEKKEPRKVKSTQRYTFEVIRYEDGGAVMSRHNDGFSVMELLGMTSVINNHIHDVFKDALGPVDKVNISSVNSPLIHEPKPL